MLPAYVFQDMVLPRKALLLQEIRSRSIGEQDEVSETIDFVNLRREHLGQLNRMLAEHFWPSIDGILVLTCYKSN